MLKIKRASILFSYTNKSVAEIRHATGIGLAGAALAAVVALPAIAIGWFEDMQSQ